MTEPSWPDVSSPLPYQPQFRRSASITSYAPAPREAGRRAHRPGIGREAVDVGGREPGVLDRGEAAVERELERIAVQPAADLGLADAA